MSKPLKQIYTCDTCGEMYQGYDVSVLYFICSVMAKKTLPYQHSLSLLQFYSKHMKEEHDRDLEKEIEEREWKPNFIIHAGRGRTPPPDYRVIFFLNFIDRPQDCVFIMLVWIRYFLPSYYVLLSIQEYECEKCDFIASKQEDIDDHVEKEHKPKPRYVLYVHIGTCLSFF